MAVLGTGDMGSAIARSLIDNGIEVLTSLSGRSANSRQLASDAGVTDTGGLAELVTKADIFLSIMPPAAAADFARELCPLIASQSPDTLFVDCNAVSPITVSEIRTVAMTNNVRFQDAGIVGAAPRADRIPVRLYTSGPFSDELQALKTDQIDVRDLGEEIGRASAFKMVYASLTKATNALRASAAIAAERLGVSEEMHAEWQHSLPSVYGAMEKRLPILAADAGRWSGEMREIAQTYESIGITPDFHRASEWLFDMLANTELGSETKQEAIKRDRSMTEVLNIVSRL